MVQNASNRVTWNPLVQKYRYRDSIELGRLTIMWQRVDIADLSIWSLETMIKSPSILVRNPEELKEFPQTLVIDRLAQIATNI